MLLDQAIVSGGNFVLGVLLARYLGLAAFGTYSLLWMGVLFALSLHQAFISQPMMTLFAQKSGEHREAYFRTIFQVQILLSLALGLLSLLAFLALRFSHFQIEWLPWLPSVGAIAAVYLLQDTLRKLFFVEKQYRPPLLLDILLYALLLGVLPVAHAFGKLDLGNALLVILLAYGLSCTVGVFQMKNAFKFFDKKTIQHTLKEHYHFSVWLLGTSLLQWFSGNFFLIAAAGVLGAFAVGALRMAQNMVGLSHVLFLAMENVVPAEAAHQFFNHGKAKMNAYLRRTSLLGAIPLLVILLALAAFSPWLIELLYGAEYVPFSYLVWAYAGHYVFVYLGFPLRFALRTLQLTYPIFVAYCVSAGISLLVAFPMAQAWGMWGVMAGLMGTQVLMLLVYTFFLAKKSGPEPVLNT